MKDLVIFGTGKLAQLAHVYFTHAGEFRVVAFSADTVVPGQKFCELPVVPFDEVTRLYPPESYPMFVGIAYKDMNRPRTQKCAEARAKGYKLASFISPTINFADRPKIGDNCLLLEALTIQPFCTIGDNVIMWSGSHLGHDVKVGSNCFISGNVVISGNAEIGDDCFLGTNSSILENVKVAPRTFVGANALITKNTPPDSVYHVKQSQMSKLKSSDLRI